MRFFFALNKAKTAFLLRRTMSFFNYNENPLENITILEDLSPENWEKIITHCQFIHFNEKETLLTAGDKDDALYILIEGQVEVIQPTTFKKNTQLAIINAGSVFGEIAFFDGFPRVATVRSLTKGHMLKLTKTGFEQLAAWDPIIARQLLMDLGRVLALRLRYNSHLE